MLQHEKWNSQTQVISEKSFVEGNGFSRAVSSEPRLGFSR